MNTEQAYDRWSVQYDTNDNKTRDLEGRALRNTLQHMQFDRCLEIGCGTGKNTSWLITKANHISAVDLSSEMLAKAREKIGTSKVQFHKADITAHWQFASGLYDLVTFSLVLEHIEILDSVFENAARFLKPGGILYLGELHPFKQYTGSKARFETDSGVQVVTCFDHHISDFVKAGNKNGLDLELLEEYFDDDNREGIPRILVLLLKKKL